MKITRNNMIVGAVGVGTGIGLTALVVKIAEDKNRQEIVKSKNIITKLNKKVEDLEKVVIGTNKDMSSVEDKVYDVSVKMEKLTSELLKIGLDNLERKVIGDAEKLFAVLSGKMEEKATNYIKNSIAGEIKERAEKIEVILKDIMENRLLEQINLMKLETESTSERVDSCSDEVNEIQDFINTAFGREAVDLIMGTQKMLKEGQVLSPEQEDEIRMIKEDAAEYLNSAKEVAVDEIYKEDNENRPKKKVNKTKNSKSNKNTKPKKQNNKKEKTA